MPCRNQDLVSQRSETNPRIRPISQTFSRLLLPGRNKARTSRALQVFSTSAAPLPILPPPLQRLLLPVSCHHFKPDRQSITLPVRYTERSCSEFVSLLVPLVFSM